MKKRLRYLIIGISFVIFVLLGSYLYLYSQGIRVDFKKWRLVKTGGFDVQVQSPAQAEVFVNGKRKKNTSFLSNTIYVKNLIPRSYSVEIKKESYLTWQKNLEVKEGLVTIVKNIVLFKQNPSFETLSENATAFWFSKDGRSFLLQEQINQGWNLILQEASVKKSPAVLADQQSLGLKNIVPEVQQWDDENQIIILKAFLPEPSQDDKLFVIDYQNLSDIKIYPQAIEKGVLKIILFPRETNRVLYLKEQKISSLDFRGTETASISKIPLAPVKPNKKLLIDKANWLESDSNNIYWLRGDGFLSRASGTVLENSEIINKTALSLQSEQRFKINTKLGKTILEYNHGLYYLAQGKFVKLDLTIDGWTSINNSSLICLWGNQEIWLWDKNQEAGQIKFLNRFWKTPGTVFWLNNDYLIFNVGDEIKISEIDERDYLNIFGLQSFKEPRLYFNQYDKKLYILSAKALFSSERLLP